ncbi:MAG: Asp-tRNA(Asn)/Glu-tRNA(Gln) amidotransferase subunit GatC [Patescibacteria group bacterium]
MISKTEIEKLASLARIDVTSAEKDSFTKQIDAILGYVDQLKQVVIAPISDTASTAVNVFREDVGAHSSLEHTDALLSEAPDREGQYVKVQKIIA